MKKVKQPFPVYDICSLNNAGGANDEIIAEQFAPYLEVHPNLHQAHRHSFYHVVLFTKGAGFHTIDFEQFPVQAGQVYFMIPGQVHSWSFSNEVDGYIINFSEQLLRSFVKDPHFVEQFPFFSGIAGEGVINLTGNIVNEVVPYFTRIIGEVRNNNPYSKEIICLQLAQLFIMISRNSTATTHEQAPQQSRLILHHFRKMVDEYYAEKKLPKEYAAMLYVTPNHLNALCKDLLGKPAGEIIRDRVLLEAKRLLINAEVTIAEIAYQLGFSDNSYFTKFFRKYTAVTPEEFRKTLLTITPSDKL